MEKKSKKKIGAVKILAPSTPVLRIFRLFSLYGMARSGQGGRGSCIGL